MRKMKIIAAICLLTVVVSMQVQAITPIQLKEARMAAYQWVRDYNIYARMDGKRNPAQKFIDLFEDESVQIFNDYLPLAAMRGEQISVKAYADILANREAIYTMSFDISDAKITSERLDNEETMVFTIEFDKTVSFQERGNMSDNLYAYPKKTYHAKVGIKYNVQTGKALASKIHSDISFGDIMVFHNKNSETVNQYTSQSELERVCKENGSTLIKWNYTSTNFDPQMVYIHQDTIKNQIHLGGGVGYAFYSANMVDDYSKMFAPKGGVSYAFSLGYYRQVLLRGNHRLGFDFSMAFSQNNTRLTSNSYHDSYKATDPDGGNYVRLIDVNHYQETIRRMTIDIPIAIRYDYFVYNNLSVFINAGANISYDVLQEASFFADARYSGYYDWLFDVTITQNGIYDFGTFEINGSTKETGINHLGISVFAGLGVQYFIPGSKWSFDVQVLYAGEIYRKPLLPTGFHLTMNNHDWQSGSYLFSSYYGQNIRLQMKFNYNF